MRKHPSENVRKSFKRSNSGFAGSGSFDIFVPKTADSGEVDALPSLELDLPEPEKTPVQYPAMKKKRSMVAT